MESKEIFRFDRVYGMLASRSNMLRLEEPASSLIEQVIGSTIDAGYQGKLHWKIKLTVQGLDWIKSWPPPYSSDLEKYKLLANCQQLHLFPFAFHNYYGGKHQTKLDPDIVFWCN